MSILDPPSPSVNPRDSWGPSTDADRWVPSDDGPRPTAGPDFEPVPGDSAEWLGMSLRLTGEPMAGPADDSDPLLSLRFAGGAAAGVMIALDADREYDQWLDRRAAERAAEAFAEIGADWHESERIAAVGCLLARVV